MLCINEIVFG